MTGNRQAFSTEEFRARVHAELEKQGIDPPLIHAPENICCPTGYQEFRLLRLSGGPGRARPRSGTAGALPRAPQRQRIFLAGSRLDLEGRRRHGRGDAALRARARRARDGQTREDGWFLTAAMSNALSAGLADARIVDARRLIAQACLIKSEAEVGYPRPARSRRSSSARPWLRSMTACWRPRSRPLKVTAGRLSRP